MDVYLAIDVKDGVVVRGKAGERREYCEVHKNSVIIDNRSDFGYVIDRIKPKNVYVADLDAIERRGNNFDIFKKYSNRCKMIVDGGFTDANVVNTIMDEKRSMSNRSKLIPVLGTETFNLRNIGNVRGKCIVSIDIKEKLLDASKSFKSVENVLSYLNSFSVYAVIVLPIHSVGTYKHDFTLVEKALKISDHPVITGGGISSISDMFRLKDMGVDGVLISSAIHDGRIDVEILRNGKL